MFTNSIINGAMNAITRFENQITSCEKVRKEAQSLLKNSPWRKDMHDTNKAFRSIRSSHTNALSEYIVHLALFDTEKDDQKLIIRMNKRTRNLQLKVNYFIRELQIIEKRYKTIAENEFALTFAIVLREEILSGNSKSRSKSSTSEESTFSSSTSSNTNMVSKGSSNNSQSIPASTTTGDNNKSL